MGRDTEPADLVVGTAGDAAFVGHDVDAEGGATGRGQGEVRDVCGDAAGEVGAELRLDVGELIDGGAFCLLH